MRRAGRFEAKSFPDKMNVQLAVRRDGRVAEGARLESVYTLTGIGGSNPSLSARIFGLMGLAPISSLEDRTRPLFSGAPAACDVFTYREHVASRAGCTDAGSVRKVKNIRLSCVFEIVARMTRCFFTCSGRGRMMRFSGRGL